jgi:hypothetical protein
MMAKGAPLAYKEFLSKYPDWILVRVNQFAVEATPELTERSRRRQKEVVGTFLQFAQEHGLVRRILSEDTQDLSDEFVIYLRDVTPEGFDVFRVGYLKWLEQLDRNINSDTSDSQTLKKALTMLQNKKAKSS